MIWRELLDVIKLTIRVTILMLGTIGILAALATFVELL